MLTSLERQKRYYKKHREKVLALQKVNRAKPKEKLRIKLYMKAWRKKNRERRKLYKLSPEEILKDNVRQKVKFAVKTGKLIRKNCARCDEKETHGHHEDYSKPLDVVWLCRVCHRKRHDEITSESKPLLAKTMEKIRS